MPAEMKMDSPSSDVLAYGLQEQESRTPNHAQPEDSEEDEDNIGVATSGHGIPELEDDKYFVHLVLLGVLLLTTVGNLVLSLCVVYVLRIGRGMQSMEPISEASVIKFFGESDLGHIFKRDGLVQGFADSPLSISSSREVAFNTVGLKAIETRLRMNATHTVLKGNKFSVTDPYSGQTVFNTWGPSLNIVEPMKQLNAKIVSTNRIASPLDRNLSIRSDLTTILTGIEGTHMDAKEMLWSADQDITLRAANGSVILGGREGVFIDVKNLPIVTEIPNVVGEMQYKLCVCMPQGKLFKVEVPKGEAAKKVSCSHINMSNKYNPCM